MLKVLTLASLFPDATRPTLGPFVERQTLGLAGHPDVELMVVSPRGLPPFPFSFHSHYRGLAGLPEMEVWKGVTVHRPRFIHWPGTGGRFDAGAMARAVLPLLRRIRQSFVFDVIDAEFFFPDGPAALKLGTALRVPVSIKARGADIHFWGTNPGTGPQVVEAGQNAAGLLAVAQSLKYDMVALGMPEERIRVHYTGVDLARFQPGNRVALKAELGVAGHLITCVGALIPRKRQGLIIDALAALPGAKLVLIGKGEDEARLKAQAAQLGVAERVRFTGAIPQDEIARWLAASDVMCLPSASEGLANAWVEALACGTPVVITNVGGARELIDRPEAGRLVEPDPGAIAAAIRAVLDSPPAPEAVRAAAMRFTWEANRDALYAHLSGLVSR
ncbi:MAG TPA: glycosyltransferase [Chakrabartia sp.]|jgi:glycosyltransferase involved in cell wall biosynthesis|nr:glycosyltransferase [Chakrabartia sp.]